jgi:hypothetical protein
MKMQQTLDFQEWTRILSWRAINLRKAEIFILIRSNTLDELRTSAAKIFWHDETWANKNEERRFVWTDGTSGIGRMRCGQNKGIHYFCCNSNDCCL